MLIGTPVTEGGLKAEYVESLARSMAVLEAEGIKADIAVLAGNCHVDDSRNHLIQKFLDSGCDQLVFIDADLSFRPDDLVKLIRFDREVVAGIYPKKRDDVEYPVKLLPGEQWSDKDGLIEVAAVPTGFLKLTREAVEKLTENCTWFQAQPNLRLPELFYRGIVDGERVSGDYMFCRQWVAQGGKIYADPEMFFGHIGESRWAGSLGRYLLESNDLLIPQCLAEIRGRKDTLQTYHRLREVWGNPYTASAEYLYTAVQMAREADSVLELGSGLSTLCLGAVGPVTSLEDDPVWYEHTRKQCAKYDIPATVVKAPLKDGWYDTGDWVADLVVCDGPNRAKGDRTKSQDLNFGKMLIDDCNPEEWSGVTMVTDRFGVLEVA